MHDQLAPNWAKMATYDAYIYIYIYIYNLYICYGTYICYDTYVVLHTYLMIHAYVMVPQLCWLDFSLPCVLLISRGRNGFSGKGKCTINRHSSPSHNQSGTSKYFAAYWKIVCCRVGFIDWKEDFPQEGTSPIYDMHVCTSYMHTCIACMHIHIAYMHICIYAYMHICTCAHMHICIAYMHTCIYACMHICIDA